MKTFIKEENSFGSVILGGIVSVLFINFLLIEKYLPYILTTLIGIIIVALYFLFYDEIMHKKYCHNRRMLNKLLDTNSGLFTFIHYSKLTNLYYFTFTYDGCEYMISSSRYQNKLSLYTEDSSGLIGYFTSNFLQKDLVENINRKLEKIRDKKVN